jgi:hypothetical protein
MKSNPEDEDLLRSYLLGELAGEASDVLERRLLADDDLFDLCEALETDLLAASARGELAPEERERVLRRLAASPQGRERLALARSLNWVADHELVAVPRGTVLPFQRFARAMSTSSRPALAAIAAALIVVIGASWLFLQRTFTADSDHHAAITSPTPPVHAPTPAPKPPVALARQVLVLSLATTRGGGESSEKLLLAAGTELVEIQLVDLQGLEEHGSFHTVVRSEKDGTVWQGDLKAQRLEWGPGLLLEIPAETLAAGSYEVTATAGNGEQIRQKLTVVRKKNG